MALQDLTPQLRTRLSKVERVVGVFVLLATLLLLAGFAYYIYSTAQRKGWFLTKVHFQTSINNAAGLKEGDPVKLMGFNVGEITKITPNDPWDYYNITVYFDIRAPHYGYIWTDSKVKVGGGDFLGNRVLEVIKGREGIPTVLESSNKTVLGILNQGLVKKQTADIVTSLKQTVTNQTELPNLAYQEMKKRVSQNPAVYYVGHQTNLYWMEPLEAPALAERMEEVVNMVTNALPNVFHLTNQIAAVLSNVTSATAQLDAVLASSRPLLTNVQEITHNIKDPNGSLGRWLIPTNLNQQLEKTLSSTDNTLESVQTNLVVLVHGVDEALMSLATIVSNLNNQVEANTNLLSNISSTIVNANEMVQGLKKHWLLRSAFKTNKTEKATTPRRSSASGQPRDRR